MDQNLHFGRREAIDWVMDSVDTMLLFPAHLNNANYGLN